ncbi:MAG: hypothetical protein J6P81_00615, partial [Spirochaetales bacterium]|nr:hypothetical protein [Spirochaetales bacterium]
MKNLTSVLLFDVERVVCTGRLDLLLPTGCPAKAAYAANPPPEALLDAPFQIQSLCPDKYKKGQVKQPG